MLLGLVQVNNELFTGGLSTHLQHLDFTLGHLPTDQPEHRNQESNIYNHNLFTCTEPAASNAPLCLTSTLGNTRTEIE